LPPAYYERQLCHHLQPCLFHLGRTLIESADDVRYVYFLKSGLVSLVMDAQDGINVEAGAIGCEGIVGAGEALTGESMASRVTVQIAGSGWRLPVDIFCEAFRSSGAMQDRVMRYQHFLAAQAARCALCNRRHDIERRLCRWLLLVESRTGDSTMELTHEFMATMLGTRRAGISVAANQLRSEGLITYKRGAVSIVNHAGMEKRACECHAVLQQQYEKLLRPAFE
jgi:CRP-like cAMP-binding protein